MNEFLPIPSEQEWTESDRQWFERVRNLEAQLRQEREAKTQLIEECNAFERAERHWRGLSGRLKAEVAQLQTTISQLDGLLNQISEISDQPFTETHEHLPAWIRTILVSRVECAKREWDAARQELNKANITPKSKEEA